MTKLEDKVAIITGGARGQGAAHSRLFVEEGAKVVVTDILEDEGEALVAELGENATFMRHDVTNGSDWERVISETESRFGPVDILINNAGISLGKPTVDMTEEEYRRVIDINQVSVFLGTKHVVPSMRKAQGGSIVNISSIAGLRGSKGALAYTASKFAVTGMTKAAAIEFAAEGIRVNSVHPGTIRTPMLEVPGTEDAVRELEQNTPMKRIADPEEASKLVLFLASDDASFSTGSEFVIDGGAIARM